MFRKFLLQHSFTGSVWNTDSVDKYTENKLTHQPQNIAQDAIQQIHK